MKHIDRHAKQVKALHKFIAATKKSGLFPEWVNTCNADYDCMSIKVGGTI